MPISFGITGQELQDTTGRSSIKFLYTQEYANSHAIHEFRAKSAKFIYTTMALTHTRTGLWSGARAEKMKGRSTLYCKYVLVIMDELSFTAYRELRLLLQTS